jgi:hypothetical protein
LLVWWCKQGIFQDTHRAHPSHFALGPWWVVVGNRVLLPRALALLPS